MINKREIIIDLDHISNDPEVLAKLYECGSLMIQSDNAQEVQSGYQMLDLVNQEMKKLHSNIRET